MGDGPAEYTITIRADGYNYSRDKELPLIHLGDDAKQEYDRLIDRVVKDGASVIITRDGRPVNGSELDSFQGEDIRRLSAYRLREVFGNYLSAGAQNSGEGSNVCLEAKTILGRLLSDDSFLETFLREFSLNLRDDSVQSSSGEDSLDDGEVPF